MNTFKETFKKYRFFNFLILIFTSIIVFISILIFPNQFSKPGHTGWDFNPFLFSSVFTILGLLISILSANGTLTKQSKGKKIACFIGIILGLALYIFGVVAHIAFSVDLFYLYNDFFNWSTNVITDTREHNVLSFYFIAPVFSCILFLVVTILYIRQLTIHNKQSTDTIAK